jgi:glycerol kinase
MESIVFLIVNNVEEMKKYEIEINQLLIAGGMSKDDQLCQSIANLCAIPVIVSSFKEATSRGAAWLAFQRPEWEMLESREYFPEKDDDINGRFIEFKLAMNELVS